MTSAPSIDESEVQLRRPAAELTQPREGECLCCYVDRVLGEIPCDGSLRHALHYRDVVAPRATGLANRLGRMGGYCDCELFMNAYELRGADPEDDAAVVPPCKGGTAGSVQPCGNWTEARRW
jgi:Protein of unknown function (DUF2695)